MTLHVKLPMCDSLAFLRLSLVEGFHLVFVQRIRIICWTFYCMIIGIDELLRMSTGYNVFFFFLVWNLPPGWKQGDVVFCFFFLMSAVYRCNITSIMIFHLWIQYSSTGRGSERTDHFLLAPFQLYLVCGFAVMWLMFAKEIATKETLLPSIFGPSKSRTGWLWEQSWSVSDPSERQGVDWWGDNRLQLQGNGWQTVRTQPRKTACGLCFLYPWIFDSVFSVSITHHSTAVLHDLAKQSPT